MRLFPQKKYSIELEKESKVAILELKKRTLSKEKYVSDWKNQTFIGKVGKNEFEMKLSKYLYGEYCVFKGKFENKNGILEIRTSRTVKIIFVSIIIFILSGIIISIFQNKLTTIPYAVLNILVFKFIFMDLGFKLVSKFGIKKLNEIIDIKEIKQEKIK